MKQQRMFATFALAVAALVATAPALADVKIAIVRTTDVMDKAPQTKAAQDKLKAEFQKRQDDFDADVKQFQDDAAKFQRDADTLPPDVKNKKGQDLQTRNRDLVQEQQKLSEDFQTRRVTLLQGIQTRVRDVINQVAKERGYDLVLDEPLYASNAIDITPEVEKRLAAQAPAPAASGK